MEFQCGRGLRQGDPPSPTLFKIVLEALSQVFHHVEEEGRINNYMMSGAKFKRHLLFADDLHAFSKAGQTLIRTIKKIRKSFSNYFGLLVNVVKSSVIFFGPSHSFIWKGYEQTPSSEGIYELIRPPLHKDPLVEGIWTLVKDVGDIVEVC